MQTTAQGRWIGGQSFKLVLAMIAVATVVATIVAITMLDDEDAGSTGGVVTSPQQQSFQGVNPRFQDMNLMPEEVQAAPALEIVGQGYNYQGQWHPDRIDGYSATDLADVPVRHGQPY